MSASLVLGTASLILATLVAYLALRPVQVTVVSKQIPAEHPAFLWLKEQRRSDFVQLGHPEDVTLDSEHLEGRFSTAGPTRKRWEGSWLQGSVEWPKSGGWKAKFNYLPSSVEPWEAKEMKKILEEAPDLFDEDRDGVDKMITYEFIIRSAGAAKAHDPHRVALRRRLDKILEPIITDRIAPFVHRLYPKSGAVCHAMIRRYLEHERRTHNTHWDIPSYVSVIISLDSTNVDFEGGFFVTTGTGLNTFLPLQIGDTVIHQSDLLHGVHVKSGNRWSLAMWFQDSDDCSSRPSDWWLQEARAGNPVAQMLRAMRASTSEEAWSWLQTAAESGFPRAQLYLGKAYHDGVVAPQNLTEAARWYDSARRGGELEASFYLGNVELARGNRSGSVALYKEGAEAGEPNAMEALGRALRDGSGDDLARNLDAATDWFVKAADFIPAAMHEAHEMYLNKTETRDPDPLHAAQFLERAARMGHPEAMVQFAMKLGQEKRWQELAPWLLRIETKSSIAQFVRILQANVPVHDFLVYRASQFLQNLVNEGFEDARQLLHQLQKVATVSQNEL